MIYTFSDRDPSLGLSDPEQGTFMTTVDQEQTVPVLPPPNPIRVVPPVTFSLDLTRSTNQRQGPDAVYYHDFLIDSNSDLTAASARLGTRVAQRDRGSHHPAGFPGRGQRRR